MTMPTDDFLALLVQKRGHSASVTGVDAKIEVYVVSDPKLEKGPLAAVTPDVNPVSLATKDRDKKRHRNGSSSRHHKKSRDGAAPNDEVVFIPHAGASGERSLPGIDSSGRVSSGVAVLKSCKSHVDKVLVRYTLGCVAFLLNIS